MWRAAIVICMLDLEALSVSIISYLRNPRMKCVHPVVSDDSPRRLCAALYHPVTYVLLGWATLRLPYAKELEGRSQGRREYLGYLFSVLVIMQYIKLNSLDSETFQYQWINEKQGAIQWASKDK